MGLGENYCVTAFFNSMKDERELCSDSSKILKKKKEGMDEQSPYPLGTVESSRICVLIDF